MEIKFIPTNNFVKNFLTPPTPSYLAIPNWYSNMNLFLDEEKSYGLAENKSTANTTMKACSPFLDALMCGYVWCLPVDLEIRKNYRGYEYFFSWRSNQGTFITHHDREQHPELPKPVNGSDLVSKFAFEFVIQTPKGYSTFFTHPLNRHDLPFRTFSGIVETDTYTLPVQFPFQLINTEKDITIIEKGTPVCQFFPFKRDNWQSVTNKEINELEYQKNLFDFHAKIKRSYKTKFWKKKEYK